MGKSMTASRKKRDKKAPIVARIEDELCPIPLGARVYHAAWGKGQVISHINDAIHGWVCLVRLDNAPAHRSDNRIWAGALTVID